MPTPSQPDNRTSPPASDHRVYEASGRMAPQLGLAALSGLLLYFSSPGSGGHGLLAWFCLVPLLLAIRDLSWRRATLLGLLAGLIYYLPLLHWITVVLGEYGGVAPAVALLALLLLALYMALYPALFAALLIFLTPWGVEQGSGRCRRGCKPATVLWAAPLIWVGLDLLRGWLFTGFPWLDIAYSQYQSPLLIQAADLVGHHGISFVIVLTNTLLALLLSRSGLRQKTGSGPAASWLRRPVTYRLLLPAILPIVALPLYGFISLELTSRTTAPRTITVSVIQGNIPQEEKWDYAHQAATVERYLELSRQAESARPELIIWPETALPFFPLEHELFSRLLAFSEEQEGCLLVGAPHREEQGKGQAAAPDLYYNSALLLASGRLIDTYHKQHLVPFGEYIPLRRLLPFFAPVVETLGDFTPGPGPVLLDCRQRLLGVLICYEAIFPELARQMTVNGAELLVNITNDAWFGPTNAPHQHLAMAVLRAVENRRSLARSANTGISALIGPDGRIMEAGGLFVADQWTADLPLPRPTSRLTLFTLGGHLFAPLCLLLLIAGIIWRIYVSIPGFK